MITKRVGLAGLQDVVRPRVCQLVTGHATLCCAERLFAHSSRSMARPMQYIFDVMGPDIDGIKFAAGSALVMQRQAVADLVDTAHENACYATSAGSLEFVLQKVKSNGASQCAKWSELSVQMVEPLKRSTPAMRTPCVLMQGPDAVSNYLKEARDIGFDVLELDTGRAVVMEPNEELQLLEDIQKVRAPGLLSP